MFFWRMVFRSLSRQMSKRLMIAVTIFLGTSLMTSMFLVMFDVGDKVQEELGSYGSNIEVLPQGKAAVSDMYDLQDDEAPSGGLLESELPSLKTIFWAYNIEAFTPFVNVKATVVPGSAGATQPSANPTSGDVQHTEESETVTISGTWFNHEMLLATGDTATTGITTMRDWWHIEGTWPAADDEAIAGTSLASERGWKVGDTLTVSSANSTETVKLVGIYDAGSQEDDQLMTELGVAQRLAGIEGEVQKVEVRAITSPENDLARKAARDPNTLSLEEWEIWYCTAYVSSVAYQIEEVMTNAVARPVMQVADTEGNILNKTQLIMTMVAVFAMLASALGIVNLVSASVMERSKEIGLKKALGARNGRIAGQILTETTIVGVFGGVVGFFAGIGLAQIVGHLVFGSGISVRPLVVGLMAGVVVLTVVLGSLPAIRMLVKLQPTQVLHGR